MGVVVAAAAAAAAALLWSTTVDSRHRVDPAAVQRAEAAALGPACEVSAVAESSVEC